MKTITRFHLIIITLLLSACGLGTENKSNQSSTQLSAKQTVVAFHHALNTGQASEVLKLLDESVLIYEGGGVERSAKEYASHHLSADIKFMSKMKVEILEHQVNESGKTAVSTSRSKLNGSYKDKTIDMETMETIVLRRKEGHNSTWLITHIHWSN